MQYSSLTERVAGRGAGAWEVHCRAIELREAGHDVIALTVGDEVVVFEPAYATYEAVIGGGAAGRLPAPRGNDERAAG
jgi:arginine:pyruvate transaminase